jgi:hypothetical protein
VPGLADVPCAAVEPVDDEHPASITAVSAAITVVFVFIFVFFPSFAAAAAVV